MDKLPNYLRSPWLHRALICLILGAALSPVIPWVQFSGGMENFNVATAVESERDNHWLMPYLGLEPRAAKPPLLHWITAVGIEIFPTSLAWGTRAPSILAACAMLLFVYELGRALEDWELGLVGALACGTTLLFLKFAWQASYDLHLALWVAAANWGLALATFRNRRWSGSVIAGVGLGLALMVKGPVAILQTVVPWVAFLAWRRWRWKERGSGPWVWPVIAGVALTLLIALPWTVYAFWVNRHMLGLIVNEVSLGTEASYETRIRWHSYIVFFPMLLPWLIWFITAFVEIARLGRKAPGMILAIFWVVLPIAVMTFFPERRDRYLLPMIGPAALIAGYGVLRHVPRWGAWSSFQKLLVILHIVVLGGICIGLPVLGATRELTVENRPWYSPAFAAAVIAVMIVIGAAGILAYRKTWGGFVGATVVLMLLVNIVFMWGYKDSSSGRSQGKVLAGEILDQYPDALVYNAAPQRRKLLPLELLIYLDRDVVSVTDPASLPWAAHPQVLIYPPADHLSDAIIAPRGFREIAQCKINTGVYHAFVRDGR